MIGAILGDMIGSPYEFDMGNKSKNFPLFSKDSVFTDDTVMTVAVAEALMDSTGKTDDEITDTLVRSMLKWGKKYPDAGYGGKFYFWLLKKVPKPYGSYGSGSAMRVSSAGWLFDTLEETRHIARLTAEVSHNHLSLLLHSATGIPPFLFPTKKTNETYWMYLTYCTVCPRSVGHSKRGIHKSRDIAYPRCSYLNYTDSGDLFIHIKHFKILNQAFSNKYLKGDTFF